MSKRSSRFNAPYIIMLVVLLVVAIGAFGSLRASETLERDNIVVIHTPRFEKFAKIALDVVAEGEKNISEKLGFKMSLTLRVYLAENARHLNSMLQKIGVGPARDWVAAVAVPSESSIFIKIPSIQEIGTGNIKQTIHHEIVHIFLRDFKIPLWLNEGLAEYISGKEITPEERRLLERTAKGRGLFSLDALESRFPMDSAHARLAYLQSAEFVRYLFETLGTDKMKLILNNIKNGKTIDQAFIDEGVLKPSVYFEKFARKKASEHSLLKDLLTSLGLWGYMALAVVLSYIFISARNRRKLRDMEREEFEHTFPVN